MARTTSWDRFRTFEAVARLGSLTVAATALGISQSTVSRHLGHLERDAGSPLLLRESPVRLTPRGQALLAAVEPMVEAATSAHAALDDQPELRGELTVTTVGEVVRWILAGRLGSLFEAYPQLRLRILADNQINSLAAGEADVALRMARPERGELIARKFATEVFDYYAAATLAVGPQVPWLGLTGSLAQLPEQAHAERAFASRPPRLLVEDIEALAIAVQAGLGVAMLPRKFASGLAGVRRVEATEIGARPLGSPPSRSLWMVVHRSKHQLPKVRAFIDWLEHSLDPRASALASVAGRQASED